MERDSGQNMFKFYKYTFTELGQKLSPPETYKGDTISSK